MHSISLPTSQPACQPDIKAPGVNYPARNSAYHPARASRISSQPESQPDCNQVSCQTMNEPGSHVASKSTSHRAIELAIQPARHSASQLANQPSARQHPVNKPDSIQSAIKSTSQQVSWSCCRPSSKIVSQQAIWSTSDTALYQSGQSGSQSVIQSVI
jgi:hypothetical protein